MKNLGLFYIFFNLSHNFSIASEYEVWHQGRSFFQLIRLDQTVLVSMNCEKKNCDALSFLEKIKKDPPQNIITINGQKWGAEVCKSNFKNKVIFLSDKNYNQNSFCLFPDQSVISTSSFK